MADKKSIFDKYKSIDENGEIKKEVVKEQPTIEPDSVEKTEEVVEEVPVNEEKVHTEIVDTAETFVPEYTFKEKGFDEIDEILKSISVKEINDDVKDNVTEDVVAETEKEESVQEEVAQEESAPEVVAETVETEEKPKKEKKSKEKKDKEPKEKKEKKTKPPKAKIEKEDPEPATKKDYLTIVLALVAVAMAIAVVMVKYFPSSPGTVSEETTTEVSEQELASIQVFREGFLSNLVPTDISGVFYQFSSDYSIQYYQYREGRMVPVKTTGTLSASVDYGPTNLPVNVDYVQVGDQVFGVGLYRPDQNPGVQLYNIKGIIFQMTNLPAGYSSEGKALLLAKSLRGSTAELNSKLQGQFDEWAESYTVDLNTGKTTRFLRIINRNTDPTTGTYVEDFCVLTKSGYTSTSGKIPFFTARDYNVGEEKEDIYVKSGSGESMLIRNASRRLLVVDDNAVIFLRRNETGFNILRKENGTESLVFKFTGEFNKCMFDGDYILDKEKATLYNMRTGEEKLIVGYKMASPEVMKVSPDGKYLIVMGYMNNIKDYQVHVFDLETGNYAKYIEKNYLSSQGEFSKNVSFVDDHTVMYMLIDPNRGRECVVLDLAKAFD